ncbi:MAG: hypothetical protein KKD31_15560 [Bacteroidetes bacterium]|nr:hypothetical protein [Bacteroidota bacterium]
MEKLSQIGNIPVDFQTLVSFLKPYRSPKDKAGKMVQSGQLFRLKKGLYVLSPEISNTQISRELIANHLYGPSCISLETALSFYGMIPERVMITQSVTPKRKKVFETSLGCFAFTSVPEHYFPIGIKQIISEDGFAFQIASPEKALCDLIMTKAGIRFQSMKSIREFLLEDLRLELSVLENVEISIIRQCIAHGYKKTELDFLCKFLENEYAD